MFRDFLKKFGWRYLPGFALMVLCSYIMTRSPLALGDAVTAAADRNRAAFLEHTLSILLIALGVFVTRFGWRWFIVRTSREMEVYLRDRLFTHWLNLPPGYFDSTRSGDLMAYAINDVNAVRMMFGLVFAQCINSVSSLLFSVKEMSAGIHPRLALFSLLPVPAALISVVVLGNVVRRRAKKAQEQFSVLSGHVQENINGMRVLKAFAQEEPQYAAYERESLEKLRVNTRWYFASVYMDPLIRCIFAVSFAIGLIYGGNLVLDQKITLSQYIAFNSYLTMIVNPIVMIGRINNNLQKGLASYKRLKTLMDAQEIPVFDRTDDQKTRPASLRAEKLSFTYPGAAEPALSDISFRLEPGRVLGIAGPTGSGKTTLLSLVLKLITPGPGEMYVGEEDILSIPAASLRRRIGYVPQDGFLFDESILENVRFFSDASDDEVRACLDVAGMTKDIALMPDGLGTLCGERGNHLSGGQRQRVSLARALVRKPDILLLDDTLSAVDAATEEAILRNLKSTLQTRTCLVVSHRLSVVKNADHILYIDAGRVTEQGTHEELMALNGSYARMYRLQTEEGEGQHEK